jgi:hypothetical protein
VSNLGSNPKELSHEPPIGGHIHYFLDIAPVSLQGSKRKKAHITNKIRSITRQANYFLTGDIKVEVQWLVNESVRYETTTSPDVDNVLKPILDALSGPEGIIINDCQVQSVSCFWMGGWLTDDQEHVISIRFDPEAWIKKEGLIFVNVDGKLCWPISQMMLKSNSLLQTLSHLETTIAWRNALMKSTADEWAARQFLPIQRFFHKAHLKGFPVVDASSLRER